MVGAEQSKQAARIRFGSGVAAEFQRCASLSNMSTFLYSIFAILAIGAIGAQWAYSRLLEIEFEDFHDQWIADGRPVAVFGGKESRKEATFIGSASAASDCLQQWLFTTPPWIPSSKEAALWHKRLRIFGAIMLSGLIILIGVVVWRITL